MFPMSLLLAPLRVPLLGLFLYVCMYVCKAKLNNYRIPPAHGTTNTMLHLVVTACVHVAACLAVVGWHGLSYGDMGYYR
jgi:hypothetical protein